MRVYANKEQDTINIVQSVASASTMVSSVAIMAKDYVLSKFPKNFIKKVYIDTAETATEQIKGISNDPGAFKIEYPSMTITPEISLDDPIAGMEKSVYMSSPNIYLRKDINRTYRKMLIDPDKQTSIYYTGDYITTNFNFKIVTPSFIQNADLAFYLKSNFQKDFFQFWNRNYIQTEVPKTFVKIIADLHDWDLDNSDDMDELRLYLIGSSKNESTIQKRINASTGKVCFFLNDRVNPLTLFTDLDCPASVIRDNQIEGEYVISFRLQISTWLPNAFIMSINKNKLKTTKASTRRGIIENSDAMELENGILTNHIFSFDDPNRPETVYFFDNFGEKHIGAKIYQDAYTHRFDDMRIHVDLMKKMTQEFKDVHRYAKELNLEMSSLVYADITSTTHHLSQNEFVLNYEDLSIDVLDDVGTDLIISLYLNRAVFETIRQAMLSDTNFFNSNFLTSIYTKVKDERRRIVVRSFKTKKGKNGKPVPDYSSSSMETMLRVKTAYGIGYIPLSKETKKKNVYRICIGYDANNDPIIRELELRE